MKKNVRRSTFGDKVRPYFMVGPAVLFLLVFTVYPLVNMVYLSFYEYNIISPKKYVGLKNYHEMFFSRKDFLNALSNTVLFSVGAVILLVVCALLLALALQKSTLINSLLQRFMFLPHICAMLAVATVFTFIMEPNGAINTVLKFFNLPAVRWLDSSKVVIISLWIVFVWKFTGYYALILLSALKGIPEEINEAAMLDDARPLKKFFKITLPMLSPQILFLVVTITMTSFKVFDMIKVMTKGGPGDSSNMLVYYIWDYAFNRMKVGYACAAGTVLLVILSVLSFFYFRSSAKKIYYQ